jgi:hypothetical protein
MTLNANKPDGTTLFSKLYVYQQETRAHVNALEIGAIRSSTAVTGITSETLEAGTLVDDVKMIDTDGTLTYITDGFDGQVVYLKIKAGHTLTVTHNSNKTNAEIYLNGGVNLDMTQYDTLALINRNGDPDAGVNGYWEEMFRTLWA